MLLLLVSRIQQSEHKTKSIHAGEREREEREEREEEIGYARA
jgi:hypothetical protein